MKTYKNLKFKIMSRVYLEYFRGVFAEYPDFFMLGVFMIASLFLVSVQDVLRNIPVNDLGSTLAFFVTALRNTSWVIQILIAGFMARIITAGILAARKNISSKRTFFKFRY